MFSVRSVQSGYKEEFVWEAEVILNQGNENIRNIGHGEVSHRKYKRLKLGGGQAYDRLSD
jgi:hypothetical protein